MSPQDEARGVIAEQPSPIKKPDFVIEGISDWAEKAYFPAAVSVIKEERINYLFITDDSNEYRDDLKLQRRVKYRKAKIIYELGPELSDRVVFLDKADQQDAKDYELIEPHAAFIVTPPKSHADIAKSWIDRERTSQIFIEKPLAEKTTDPSLPFLATSRVGIYNIDHYLLRASWLANLCDNPDLFAQLGTLHGLKLRMIETSKTSIEDLSYRQGTQAGLILDMMPHLLALVNVFGNLDSINLNGCGLYVARCADAPPSYDCETFAKTNFTFGFQQGDAETNLAVEVAIGKGLALSPGDRRPGKYLELWGDNGALVANLEGDFAVRREDKKGTSYWFGDLPQNPYVALLREIAHGSDFPRALLTVTTAKRILEILEDMRAPIIPSQLPGYSLGTDYEQVLQLSKPYSLS